MAICPFVPQDPDLEENSRGNWPIAVLAAVVHDTIGVYTGPDSGDSQYIENHELAHFSIGEDEGEWEQLLDTGVFAAHANGANRYAFGVEFSRLESGMLLTDWQKRCWGRIARWAQEAHGIPLGYLDPAGISPASVWVNGGMFRGWISHRSVKTDDNTAQHTDFVRYSDWQDAIGATEEDDDVAEKVYIAHKGHDEEGIFELAGNTRRHVLGSEWAAENYAAAVAGKPAPHAVELPDEWWDSIPDISPHR